MRHNDRGDMARHATLKDAAVRPYRFVGEAEWTAIFAAVEQGDTLAAAVRSVLGAERDPSVAYNAIANDPVGLGRQYQNAKDSYVATLYREAHRRAVAGTPEGVYYQGARVDTVMRYSDALLTSLIRRHDVGFLDKRGANDVRVTTHADDDFVFALDFAAASEMPADVRAHIRPILEWLKARNATLAVTSVCPEGDVPMIEASADPFNVTEAEALW